MFIECSLNLKAEYSSQLCSDNTKRNN